MTDPGTPESQVEDAGPTDVMEIAVKKHRTIRRKKPARLKVKTPVKTPEEPVKKKDKDPSRIKDLRETSY
ncbi:MAG: hypothetical protein ISR64_05900 [Deltaproteobacteria bacterium]|nr:hypothetical protein [Deltaproteobacteria bacterium]